MALGLYTMLFFFSIFVGVAVWAYWPSNRQRLESFKHLPLADGADHGK